MTLNIVTLGLLVSLAEVAGPSLNSAPILSNYPGPPQLSWYRPFPSMLIFTPRS